MKSVESANRGMLVPEMIFPGEQIVHVTGYHWIYVFQAFLPFFLVVFLGTFVWALVPTRITSILIMLAFLTSIGWIVIRVIDTIVMRCYVTNRRLINRTGWATRDTKDVTLDRIGGIFLDQTPMERFLGYGRVKLIVPLIVIELPEYLRNPIAFRNSLYAKPVAKPDDKEAAEEELRQAMEKSDDERFGTETVSLRELQEAESDLEGDELGADLGADLGGELGDDLGSDVEHHDDATTSDDSSDTADAGDAGADASDGGDTT